MKAKLNGVCVGQLFYTSRMNWVTQIEKWKSFIVGGVLLIALASLVVTILRGPLAFDPFWHLQMGKDWLDNGLSPWVDHYSFTFNGQQITNPPVIFQALLHLTVSQFDLKTGFIIVKFAGYLLVMGAIIMLLRQMKASTIIYAIIIPVIVFLLQLRPLVRPELFSYTFSIIALMLYIRATNGISVRNLLPIVTLMWVWSFYHSSVIGYVIFFGFFLDCAVFQFKSRAPFSDWSKWFVGGMLVVAVGFLNPSFSHPLIQALTFPSEWKVLIAEYMPSGFNLISHSGTYVLMLFAVLTPLMALKQRKFGILVVLVVLVLQAILMQRMVTPAGIVIVMLAAYLLIENRDLSRLNLGESGLPNRIFWIVSLGLLSVTLYSNVKFARDYMSKDQSFIGWFPTAIADYMIEKQVYGRIFNSYGMGGYLIYRLSPQNQVYIDGRTQILYPMEHMRRYVAVFRTADPELLRAELDEYSIDLIMWSHSQVRHDLVQDIQGFGLDFLDARYVLYKRGNSNFPLLGKLLSHPECWSPDMLNDLEVERQRMEDILPKYSALFPFADLVVGYSNADDGKAHIDANFDGDKWFDEMRRFAGYRFLETGEYDLVVYLLGGVELHKPKDYLASALAKLMAGDFKLASQILEDFSNTDWRVIKPDEFFIQYKLYQLLSTYKSLTPIEQKNARSLKEKLLELGYSNLGPEFKLGAKSFCTYPWYQPDSSGLGALERGM